MKRRTEEKRERRTLRIVSGEEIEAILLVGRGEENGGIDLFQGWGGGAMGLIESETKKASIFRGAEEMSNGIGAQIQHLDAVESGVEQESSRGIELHVDQRVEEVVLLQILLDGQATRILDVVQEIDLSFLFFRL